MMNWKSILLSVLIGASSSLILIGNQSKTIAGNTCSSATHTKVDFETSTYWISIECHAGQLIYIGSDKNASTKVEIPAVYDQQTETYIARSQPITYQINFVNLNIYDGFQEVVEEPVLNIYTNSDSRDLDFFNPNRKVAQNSINIYSHE